jgi:hypothetical protein
VSSRVGVRPSAIPLNELLSGALADLTQEIGDASLPVCENLLRLILEDGIDVRDVPRLACVSKRAAHWDAAIAQRNGWVTVTDKHLRLTPAGLAVRDGCAKRVDAAEAAWRERLGDAFTKLRTSLEALVSQFDLELPHHPVGYGPADPSVTGGVMSRWGRQHALRAKGLPGRVYDPGAEHAAAEAWEVESGGRLYVRETGQDWRPVARGEGDTVSALSLSALLSQAVTAFSVDYEGCGGLSLARSGNVLRAIPDEGMEVKIRAARSLGMATVVPADGMLAGLERHDFAALTPDPDDKRKGWFTLTEKGRLVRDAYDSVVVAIEQRWKRRYGATLVRNLRSALTSVRRG